MKVTINEDACIGCGACSQICSVFGFDEAEGHATIAAPEEIEANKKAYLDNVPLHREEVEALIAAEKKSV